ncbi:MAG TPA: type II secretion system protein [Blastocatellia bacterium]|nr:type II secretion system protein [Blastocatellia bacterium]
MVNGTKEHGFSLLELLVALGVMTIVMGTVFELLNRFQMAYRYEEAYTDAQRNARFAVGRVNEIMRSAGTHPTGTTTVNAANFLLFLNSSGSVISGVGPVSSSSIRLKADLDGDGLFNTRVSSNSDVIVTSEDVTLQLVGDQMMLTDNTTTAKTQVPIAEGISAVTFSDPDGSRRDIEVVVSARPFGIAADDPRYREVTYTSNIRIRNR